MVERYREGDFLETKDGLIFDVKGLVHPPGRVIAYIRYVPDVAGERERLGRRYRKVYSLPDRETYLRAHHPEYVFRDLVFNERLQGPPVEDIATHHDPRAKLQVLRKKAALDETQRLSLELADAVTDSASLSYSDLGVSGSVLIDLHKPSSDLDIMVYGAKAATDAFHALQGIVKPGGALQPYTVDELRTLYEFRSRDTQVSFEEFVQTERRKLMQGRFGGRDYFLRFVKNWEELDETYGDRSFQPVGQARVKAKILDAKEAILTPCVYKVSTIEVLRGAQDLEVSEIASYRGRFCEHALEGETVVAQGKVEKVLLRKGGEYVRLLLGGSREHQMLLEDD